MYLLTNKAERAMGLPSPYRSVVLDVGESEEITDKHFQELLKSSYTVTAIESGAVEVVHTETEAEPPPERGVKLKSVGERMWQVIVNGFPVSDKPVDKDEAERIAGEYE